MRWPWTTRAKFDAAMTLVHQAQDTARRALEFCDRLAADNAKLREQPTVPGFAGEPDLAAMAPATRILQ